MISPFRILEGLLSRQCFLQEIMEDPLVAADGYTYEAEAIREWLNDHNTSPMTNLRLENLNLVSNRIVRSAIQEWLQSNES